jgi:transketolase
MLHQRLARFSSSTDASVPHSLRRVAAAASTVDSVWVGPEQAAELSAEDREAYTLAHQILCHLAVQAPTKHASGHPGGPLSAFTFTYWLSRVRDPSVDQPLRISAGHLSLLSYGLQWLFGREGEDVRLASPQAIIDSFRIPSGLPGHIEAGIGDIPFGTGPLGKGVSHGLGTALGLKMRGQPGAVDVLLADGDAQEGQVAEALRLAPSLGVENLFVHVDLNDVQLSGLPSQTVSSDLAALAHACGWRVIEVQDGNDPAQVAAALAAAREVVAGRPTFLCYYTTMGHGIPLMEAGANTGSENFHGSPLKKDRVAEALAHLPNLDDLVARYAPFRASEQARYERGQRTQTDLLLAWDAASLKKAGYVRRVTDQPGAMRKDFGETHLAALMAADARIVVLHADLAGSGGFDKVAKAFPGRVLNVGVAEANMAMMAAGLRQAGLLPVTYTFAAFGTNEARANARLIDVNCGHTRCGVLHDCTHAGLSVGEDGETHQERNYLNLPFDHTQVWVPGDSNQAAAMAERALELVAEGHQSVYVFSGRGNHPQVLTPAGDVIYGPSYTFDGHIDLVRGRGDTGDQVTVLSFGECLHTAIRVADDLRDRADQPISVRVLNVGCVRPLDASAVVRAALETQHLLVLEDHHSEGGLATQVADVLADFNLPCTLRRLGVNQYFPSGPAQDLYFLAGLDADSLMEAIEEEVRAEVCGGEDILLSCLYALPERVLLSRFRVQMLDVVAWLQQPGAFEALRRHWASRAVEVDALPTVKTLLQRLSEVPLTGKGGEQ